MQDTWTHWTEQADTGTHTEQGQGTHDIGHIAKMIHCPVNSLMTLTPMTALFWRVGGAKVGAEEECELMQN